MSSHSHDEGAEAVLPSSLNLTSAFNSSLLNSTSALLTPSSFLSTCSPVHFSVPLFGGADAPTASNAFTGKNQEAHFFLGGCLCVLVFAWSLFALEFTSVRRSLLASGSIQTLMGAYLALWLFVFMHPHDLLGLWAYSTRDLLQLQHLSIAALLLAAGLLELGQATLMLTHPQWSVLWTFCMGYVGLVFFAHEQHSYLATVQHIALGFAMVCGAVLQGKVKESLQKELAHEVAREKRRPARRGRGGYQGVGRDSDSEDEEEQHPASRIIDCNLILSGAFFAVAAAILILFRDHSHGLHTGTSTYCQPAWPLTAGGYVVALLTITAVGVTVCLSSERCKGCADVCCPVDESRNAWLIALNCLLCVKRSARKGREEEGRREPVRSGAATAAMLQILKEKEEEEERERDRAVRRLQEMQRVFEHITASATKPPTTSTSSQRKKARPAEEEVKEESEPTTAPDSPDDEDAAGGGRESWNSTASTASSSLQ